VRVYGDEECAFILAKGSQSLPLLAMSSTSSSKHSSLSPSTDCSWESLAHMIKGTSSSAYVSSTITPSVGWASLETSSSSAGITNFLNIFLLVWGGISAVDDDSEVVLLIWGACQLGCFS